MPAAFENGEWIARTEERLGTLFEPALQQALASPLLTTLSSYTYWLSQFVIVGGALFWVYFRHHERFAFFRNWLILANMIGLVCYVLIPTAPPRMFPELGFSDTLAESASIDHGSVGGLANQCGHAESSRDGCAHRRRCHVHGGSPTSPKGTLACLACVFAVIATGNHYWLDIAVGIVFAILTALVLRPELGDWGFGPRGAKGTPRELPSATARS